MEWRETKVFIHFCLFVIFIFRQAFLYFLENLVCIFGNLNDASVCYLCMKDYGSIHL